METECGENISRMFVCRNITLQPHYSYVLHLINNTFLLTSCVPYDDRRFGWRSLLILGWRFATSSELDEGFVCVGRQFFLALRSASWRGYGRRFSRRSGLNPHLPNYQVVDSPSEWTLISRYHNSTITIGHQFLGYHLSWHWSQR